MKAFLTTFLLFASSIVAKAQDETEQTLLRSSELLLSLDRKVASGDRIGLWYRDSASSLAPARE